ncbi:sortase B protein-sorting domain-containing protein [Paenibacillus prosopidis]|uniref:LPXTG-motif cell wall-anchored protein/predicted secreted protein n=1 Tax=Paenibacillus prosopidis TaxID=630520 RepID=A0A368VSS5_9BACL|nr:sortase B protein-sorting domain-containing protein [Paenibacillus prosopidis]RCW43517.1 LPXTG-motif cell wall-anchored protein/predicted secreted protein [Paenibacillus prosopidis]
MKGVSKVAVSLMVVFSLMLYMAAFASAASTTGLKDGVYGAETQPTKSSNSIFKLIVAVADGKVSTVDFGMYNGPAKLNASIAEFVPEDQRENFKAMMAEIADYQEQLNSKLDGAKVVKSTKSAKGAGIYETLQQLWKDVAKDAGGTIEGDAPAKASNADSASSTASNADSASSTASSSNNPKTGDSSMVLYYVLAGAALVGMVALGRKKHIV